MTMRVGAVSLSFFLSPSFLSYIVPKKLLLGGVMASENRRVDSIRVRLSDDMMKRFEFLASRFGMPPATLAAFAIARFVTTEENNHTFQRDAVSQMADKMGALDFDSPAFDKVMASVVSGFLQSGILSADDLKRIGNEEP
jgi:predicted transcriptional regulator